MWVVCATVIIVCYLLSDVILFSPPPPPEMNLMLCQCRAWDPPTTLCEHFQCSPSQATQHKSMSTEECVCGTVVDMRMVSVLLWEAM